MEYNLLNDKVEEIDSIIFAHQGTTYASKIVNHDTTITVVSSTSTVQVSKKDVFNLITALVKATDEFGWLEEPAVKPRTFLTERTDRTGPR